MLSVLMELMDVLSVIRLQMIVWHAVTSTTLMDLQGSVRGRRLRRFVRRVRLMMRLDFISLIVHLKSV